MVDGEGMGRFQGVGGMGMVGCSTAGVEMWKNVSAVEEDGEVGEQGLGMEFLVMVVGVMLGGDLQAWLTW